jgi:carbon-monoxide dehydrogenase medium subunit
VIPGAFDYHRPQSVDEAVALLAAHGDEGRLVAGGHSLIPMMKLRLANPAHLIDLRAIAALKGIEEAGGAIQTVEFGDERTVDVVLRASRRAESARVAEEVSTLDDVERVQWRP